MDYLAQALLGSQPSAQQQGLFGGSGLFFAAEPWQAAMQQEQQSFLAQRMAAQQQTPLALVEQIAAMQPYCSETPKRKKVESKVIETTEIRPKQDICLLKAGQGL